MTSRRAFFLVAVLSAFWMGACGPDAPTQGPDDLGPPPGAGNGGAAGHSTFDPTGGGPPGNDGSGAAYGSGANTGHPNGQGGMATGDDAGGSSPGDDGSAGSGGDPVTLPMCTDDLKRCDHVFSYPIGSETSVEVRGDFAPGAWDKGVPLAKLDGTWQVTVPVPWNKDVQYLFYVDGTYVLDPNNPDTVDNDTGGKNSHLAPTTCAGAYTCAEPPVLGFDWRDAVMYFVFTDRFQNGDPSNDGSPIAGVDDATQYKGGDWAGVTQRIQGGYFSDLGVNTLWITVPTDNTELLGAGDGDGHNYSGYHGYWPSDLDKVEEHFGTDADLTALVTAAHDAKMKVLFDYAMNHVHVSSPTYQQHMNDWFWPDELDGHDCNCGHGCSYDDPVQNKRCWFAPYLPTFNFQNADARAFSVGNAVALAQKFGADGFRLDAVKQIEPQWLIDTRAKVTSDLESVTMQHFYMVGETYSGNRDDLKPLVSADKLDGQFDFPFRFNVTRKLIMRYESMQDLESFLSSNEGYYGSQAIMSPFLGNADMPRTVHFAEDVPVWNTEYADGKDRNWSNQPAQPASASPYERMGVAFTLLFTTKGIPLVYYGDEVGLAGAGDPDNRRMMQFDGYNAGQQALLDHVKKLSQIRAAHSALRHGQRVSLGATQETLGYKMSDAGDVLFVVLNRSDSPQQQGGLPSGSFQDLLTGTTVSGPTVTIPARGSMVLQPM